MIVNGAMGVISKHNFMFGWKSSNFILLLFHIEWLLRFSAAHGTIEVLFGLQSAIRPDTPTQHPDKPHGNSITTQHPDKPLVLPPPLKNSGYVEPTHPPLIDNVRTIAMLMVECSSYP